jgi:hypothetical protein
MSQQVPLLANLMPETAEEAMALVPSLKVRGLSVVFQEREKQRQLLRLELDCQANAEGLG